MLNARFIIHAVTLNMNAHAHVSVRALWRHVPAGPCVRASHTAMRAFPVTPYVLISLVNRARDLTAVVPDREHTNKPDTNSSLKLKEVPHHCGSLHIPQTNYTGSFDVTHCNCGVG